MQHEIRALVPLRTGGADELPEVHTHFGAFLAAVAARRVPGTHTTAAGAAMWSDVPFELMVIHGLWPVLIRAAQKLALPLRTQDEVLAVAARVNTMIECGLVLSYPNTDTAAHAFEERVIRAVEAKLAKLPDGYTTHISAFWQNEVAQFFGALIRRAQEVGETAARMLEDVEGANITNSGVAALYIHEDYRWWVRALSWDEHDINLYNVLPLKELVANITNMRIRQQALLALPHMLHTLPGELSGTVITLEQWLETQLLLAATDLPSTRNHLEDVEFAPTLELLNAYDTETLITRFWNRMRARGFRTMEAAARTCLNEVLRRQAENLRTWPPTITDFTLTVLLIRVRGVTLSHDEAVIMANSGAAGAAEAQLLEMAPIERVRYLRDHVYRSIVWGTVDAATALRMVEAGLLPEQLLAEGIEQMVPAERDVVVTTLFGLHTANETVPIVQALVERGLTPSAAEGGVPDEYLTNARPEYLAAQFEALMRTEALPVERDSTRESYRLFEMARRMPVAATQRIFNDPALRYQIFRWLMVELHGVNVERGSAGVQRKNLRVFHKNLGDDLWVRYALAIEVDSRSYEYEHGFQEESLGRLVPWERIPEDRTARMHIASLLGVVQKHVAAIIAEHTEESILWWLHEGKPDVNDRLEKYRRDRERYFADQGD